MKALLHRLWRRWFVKPEPKDAGYSNSDDWSWADTPADAELMDEEDLR